MACKAVLILKKIATIITLVRFLSSMNSIMNWKVILSIENLATLITFVRFLPRMTSLMINCKTFFLTKVLATLIIFVRSLA